MIGRIYLDYASLTSMDPRVIREVKLFSSAKFANPSSIYKEGVNAKKALIEARKKIAVFLNGHADEVFFTSGGTESNNLAILGVIEAAKAGGIKNPHIVISAIEHSSIIVLSEHLIKQGVEVTKIPVDQSGQIDLDKLRESIKENTVLVSVIYVNNEIGVVQNIAEVMRIIRKTRKNGSHYPLFHTDAAQAAVHFELNVEKMGVDLLTLDGGKIYGPRGIGILYVRRMTPILPVTFGGGQEKNLRSGTENLPAVMGMAKSLDLIRAKKDRENARIAEIKEIFLKGLIGLGKGITKTCQGSVESPHILNISIPGIDNEFFVLQLDAAGIACSTKSSCLRDEDESYVLRAIGKDSKTAIRFSFGRFTTKSQVRRALVAISNILC